MTKKSADQLTIAMAQLNPIVGDVHGNLEKAQKAVIEATSKGADLIVFGELFITGYPPEDLILKRSFQNDAITAVKHLAEMTTDSCAILISTPWLEGGEKPFNAIVLLEGGEVKATRYKYHLPNYGVFDEVRVFDRGPMPGPISFKGVRLGCMICEDMWEADVGECLQETGAEILIVPNGSPFNVIKRDQRLFHAVARVKETGLPLVYVNLLGGQDELVFDGASFVLNADCNYAVQSPSWEEAITLTNWSRTEDGWICAPGEMATLEDGLESMYQAATLGLRDYVGKNGFPGVILGLSGGIDSALSAAIAVDALGAERVHCVMMPSKYTSQVSLDDASACAKALGLRYDTIPIGEGVGAFDLMLAEVFEGREPDTTEENIQARIRGVLLMAISNKFGYMVLTTGNKSEMSVGYATLYGDMCGGYSVLKDIYKMDVFALSRWRNENLSPHARGPRGLVIPENIITRPPSAELREDQLDQDSLPPYDQLDDILKCLIEEEMSFNEIVARGHKRDLVARIEHMVYIAEYKRRQAPPGVKIGTRNFGRDRRYPITNGFRDSRDLLS